MEDIKTGSFPDNGIIRLLPADTALAESLTEYRIRNKSFLAPFEPARDASFYTIEAQEEFLRDEMEKAASGQGYRFFIVLCEQPDRIIGHIALSNIVRGAFQSCFCGAALDGNLINRGYMTMATCMLVEHAFKDLKLHRIEANVMPRNKRSLRVLEKCGFENEGLSPRYLQINGIWEDHVHMVKRNTEMEQESR